MDSTPQTITKTLDKIEELYSKLGYMDQYGGSVVLFIIISITLVIIVSYCISKSNAQNIIDDWANQRCSVTIIPFAGMITHPENMTAFEYTQENFNYCTQQILSSISAPAIEPLSFITSILISLSNQIQESLQAARAMFNRIRLVIESIVGNIMSRLVNIMTPLQKIILGGKDILNKMQGTMTTILFSALGGYYSLKSLLGAVAQFISNMLISLAILIVILWIMPFTWGFAGVMSGVFIATAVPFAVLLIMMKVILNIDGYKVPKLKCFDKNTLIPMNDGNTKQIYKIQVGDILYDNNKVTGIICVETKGSIMYYLNSIFVSDTHIVNYNRKWIPVYKHPDAIKCAEYNEPYLYCLNTSNKTIIINNITFTDWDEIYGKNIKEIRSNTYIKLDGLDLIHKQLDGGFEGSTMVKLVSGEFKKIKDILIGDTLEKNEVVYGIVEIDGTNLNEQFKFILGKNIIEGGPNLVICDSKIDCSSTLGILNKIKLQKNHDKLYHLLTDKKTFTIENIQFYDYNAAIDIFLEKNDQKLLSMKYV